MAKNWFIALAVVCLALLGLGLGVAGLYWLLGAATPESVWNLIQGVGAVLLAAGIFAAPVGIARWVLRPLDEAAKRSRTRMQFTLLDFFCLFALVQSPMAVIHGMLLHTPPVILAFLDLFAWACVGSMWFLGVWAMSRAGIVEARDRCLFLLVVLPVSIVSVLEFPGWSFVAHLMTAYSRPLQELLPLIVVLIAALAGVYPCGRLMRRIVARIDASQPHNARDVDLFAEPAGDEA